MSLTKTSIHVGHSPDPDDAFMFHALANRKIDTGPYDFQHELVDIETLNRRAFTGELELTAVSLHGYAYLTDKYMLCPCGASMGDGYGPMVVAKHAYCLKDLRHMTIAVPGTLTTAYLALRLCLGREFKHVVVPFDEIIAAVEQGEYQGRPIDAGLIIHEGQLTYADRGLTLIVDTGKWWLETTGLPLAAGRQRHSQGPGPRSDSRRQSLAQAEHRIRPGAPRTKRSTTPCNTAAIWTRNRPTGSWACTSTTGRSTSVPAAAKRCARCWPAATPPASFPAVVPEFVED